MLSPGPDGVVSFQLPRGSVQQLEVPAVARCHEGAERAIFATLRQLAYRCLTSQVGLLRVDCTPAGCVDAV